MRKSGSFPTKEALTLGAAAAALWLLLTHAEQAKQGASEALTLCGAALIPSLFPLLTVSRFAAACRCPPPLQALFSGPLRKLFGLSPGCLTPLLLGLTGGYPLAAKSARAALAEGHITQEDARRLTLFFTCPGIPFAAVAAGDCFRSRAVGWTLLASCAAADCLAAFAYHLFTGKPAERPSARPKGTPGRTAERTAEKLVRSVEGAAAAMLSICAWICAFSAFLAAFRAATGGLADRALSLTAEVTAALRTAANAHNAPLTAACLAFGGLCVFCQLLPEIRACGCGAARFLAVRAVCAGLSYLTETGLLRLLSVPVPTDARLGDFHLAANSAAASAFLLFLCAVFMAETAKREF